MKHTKRELLNNHRGSKKFNCYDELEIELVDLLLSENKQLRRALKQKQSECKKLVEECLEICGEDCAGDSSVGLPPCPFYDFDDVDADGKQIKGGCRIRVNSGQSATNGAGHA